MKMDFSQFQKVKYLDPKVVGDRIINLMPFWDGKEWFLWLPISESELQEAKAADAAHSDYVAKSPARDTDLFVPFVDFMYQRASWPEICPFINAISEDFHNLATSVAKLRYFHTARPTLDSLACSLFAATEIEYLTIVSRGIFDLMQEALSIFWKRITFIDPLLEKNRKQKGLPKTFSKIILNENGAPRNADEIKKKFPVTNLLASEYEKIGPFFQMIRSSRDKIVHGTGTSPFVHSTEKGFCVDTKTFPFKTFSGWKEEHKYNDNLVSVLPWIANVVELTINACGTLVSALAREVTFPPEIAPGYRIFVRGMHNEALIGLIGDGNTRPVWWKR